MKPEVLRRPFPPDLIKQRQGQGKMLAYVEVSAVIERLNEACDHAWSFECVEHKVYADEIVVLGRLTADGVVKTAFGGTSITRDRNGKEVSIADDLKAAASDALKKAASLLGVPLHGGGDPATRGTEPKKQHVSAAAAQDRLTPRQLAAIHSASRRRGITPMALNTMVFERFGLDGPQFLSRGAASNLIAELSGADDVHA